MNPIKTKKIHYFIGKEKKDILGICDDNENLGVGKQVFYFALFINVFLLLKYTCTPLSNLSIV